MKFQKGDLFTTELKAIGHGVNCAGVMGAGIAKPIKDKWPNNYNNYRAVCLAHQLKPGDVFVGQEGGMTIFNMSTQNRPGRDAQYRYVFSAGLRAAEKAVEMGLDSIAIPMIGCGIGGLDWWKVELVLRCVEEIIARDFEWEVWMQ